MADFTPASHGQLSADGRWRWDGKEWRSVETARLPAWARADVRWQATSLALVAAAAVGLIADQALRIGVFGLAASVTFLVAAVVLLTVGRLERIESRILVAASVMFAAWFSLRASPWLLWPDLAASLLLLGAAATFAARGTMFDLGVAEVGARAMLGLVQLAAGAGFVFRPLLQTRARMRASAPVLRGVVIAAPIAALLGWLLASADPVFASFFNFNLDFGRLVLDVVFIAIGALAAAGLLRLAASEPLGRVDGPTWRLGSIETLVVIAVLDAIFAAFAVAQLLAVTGAADETLRSAGVTYADYARSGFFQLLWVSGITLGLLVMFNRISRFADRRSRFALVALVLGAIALTLMIDVVAFRRLSLYEEAYGFTMLRLYSHVFAMWLALVFLVLAAEFAGVWSRRQWFVGVTAATAMIVLLGLNIASPEALVVAFNTNHAQTAHKIDAAYLAELSSDATPALLQSRALIDPALRAQVTSAACQGTKTYGVGWSALNLSDAQAAAARRAGC